LIRRIARENPSWGEERIANKLLLKLGLRVSSRTIRKYMPKVPARSPRGPRGDQRWVTFLKNHARVIVAYDFCVAVTATFRILYVLVVMEHASRRLLHLNTTLHPMVAGGVYCRDPNGHLLAHSTFEDDGVNISYQRRWNDDRNRGCDQDGRREREADQVFHDDNRRLRSMRRPYSLTGVGRVSL
jgi:hypothetical protein